MTRRLATFALCLLTGCGVLTSDEQPPQPDPLALPPSLLAPCAAPVVLPETGLTDQQIEIYWGRDRSALRACGSSHAGLIEAVQ